MNSSLTPPLSALKGGRGSGNSKCGKGMKLELVVDQRGRPLAVVTAAANHSEVGLALPTLARLPARLMRGTPVIADRAYDSDLLRQQVASLGLTLIAPHRRVAANRQPTMDDDCADTVAVGSSNEPLPGSSVFRRVETRRDFYSFIYHGSVNLLAFSSTKDAHEMGSSWLSNIGQRHSNGV